LVRFDKKIRPKTYFDISMDLFYFTTVQASVLKKSFLNPNSKHGHLNKENNFFVAGWFSFNLLKSGKTF